jgi:putative endonuclease
MSEHIDLGIRGEEIAFQFLIKKGYRIINRNWRFGKEELDIIAIDGNELVIVEVKTRSASIYETPSESITPAKIKSIVNAAEGYIFENDINFETRFDVISIKWFGNGKHELEHIENAFSPPVN